MEEKTKEQEQLEYAMKFAKLEKQMLRDLDKNNQTTTSFSTYTVEQILTWLKSPQSSQANLRTVSNYMFNRSSQYKRLIMYYTMLPTWSYTLSPTHYDPSNAKKDTLTKQYYKVAAAVENMNIKHEMQKMTNVAWREDVFYGVEWSNNTSFFIQRIKPEICYLSSVTDGVYNFAIDMSQIKEEDLPKYPPEITTMWNTYKSDGQRLQEVPEKISWCIKACETVDYPYPPFAGTLPYLYDIEDYISLQKQRTKIGNYKLLGLEIPLDDDGKPLFDFATAQQYYTQVLNNVPDYVGVTVSPFKMESYNFEKSGGLASTNEVADSEETFWNATGTSGLLFGSSKNDSSSAMKLSITADEGMVFALMTQCERLINRHLKDMSGATKFKINILPVTIYNKADMASLYQGGATYGLPVKSSYAAVMNLQPLDIAAMNFIEMDALGMGELMPMASSYTQPSDGGGRPTAEESGEDIGDAGEQTRDIDANDDKVAT